MRLKSAAVVEIIAHRGASFDAPENTLAALSLGYQQKADAVELDLRLTKDGQPVVIHDANTRRVAGVASRVASRPFAQLRRLDVAHWGKWKGRAFSEQVPSLAEALAVVPEGKRLFLELKCGPALLPALARALQRAAKPPPQTVIIGFGYRTVRRAKAMFPALEVGWLASRNRTTRRFPPLQRLILRAKAANLDALDLEAGFPIDKEFVRQAHQAGLKLYTWTIDDPALARRQAAAGVDGITTNRPGWLREQLRL
jgi:glycerophosphoryl diester phosphodiesterase